MYVSCTPAKQMMTLKNKAEKAPKKPVLSFRQDPPTANGEVTTDESVVLREKAHSASSASSSSGKRSMTLSGLNLKRFRKSQSIDEQKSSQHESQKARKSRATSMFYDSVDITRSVTQPAEFELLHLQNKNMDELHQLLEKVFLSDYSISFVVVNMSV